MQDVASIHAVSLGKRAVGLTSGRAINALAENDMSQLSMTQESIEEAVQEAATCMLLLAKAYYTESKYTRMLDRNGRLVFTAVESTAVEDDPEVFLEAGSLFRNEAGDREAKALDLLQAGLITPDEAKKAITFRTEPYDVIQDLEEQRHAQELLDAVVQLGVDVELFDTDNFKVLEQVFRRFLRSYDFYQLPRELQDKEAHSSGDKARRLAERQTNSGTSDHNPSSDRSPPGEDSQRSVGDSSPASKMKRR